MNLGERIKNILLAPKAEWATINVEPAATQTIFTGYVMILAAIAPVLMVVASLGRAILPAIGQYVIGLAMTFVLAIVVDALSPSFGGSKNLAKSLALVAYSWTGVWIVGGIAAIVPPVAGLLWIAAVIYAFYTLYLGAPILGRASAEKAVGFTVVVVLCTIVLVIVFAVVLMPSFGVGRMWV